MGQEGTGEEGRGGGRQPHHGEVVVLRGRPQAQQLLLLGAHPHEQAVEDVVVPLLLGLAGREFQELVSSFPEAVGPQNCLPAPALSQFPSSPASRALALTQGMSMPGHCPHPRLECHSLALSCSLTAPRSPESQAKQGVRIQIQAL